MQQQHIRHKHFSAGLPVSFADGKEMSIGCFDEIMEENVTKIFHSSFFIYVEHFADLGFPGIVFGVEHLPELFISQSPTPRLLPLRFFFSLIEISAHQQEVVGAFESDHTHGRHVVLLCIRSDLESAFAGLEIDAEYPCFDLRSERCAGRFDHVEQRQVLAATQEAATGGLYNGRNIGPLSLSVLL